MWNTASPETKIDSNYSPLSVKELSNSAAYGLNVVSDRSNFTLSLSAEMELHLQSFTALKPVQSDAIDRSSAQPDSAQPDSLTGIAQNDTLVAPTSSAAAPSQFSPIYGYGLVDAASAVATALNTSRFADVQNLDGENWGNDLVNASEAWARGYTGQNTTVAVIDTGIDYTHSDLDANIWINTDEIAGNGIDDDQNGYVDDERGWDFVDADNDPSDSHGHGTHVAGTIAAENNGVGTTGVAYNAKIMPVRVLGNNGGSNADVSKGICYAADNGADVINLSLGGRYSPSVEAAIEYATNRGAVVVMAAGNAANIQPGYPAHCATRWGIAVGAVDRNYTLASFSNWAGFDSRMQYVAAPGVAVYSTLPGNQYGSFSGTSMAAPHVAGVAALVLSANPGLTPDQTRQIITASAA